jgi:hypothetical protein
MGKLVSPKDMQEAWYVSPEQVLADYMQEIKDA